LIGLTDLKEENLIVHFFSRLKVRKIRMNPKNIHPIDITKKKKGDVRPDPCEYWRYTSTKPDDENRLKIEIGKFYILRSKERICLPSGVAVYARAMDETLGEMRIHYAGFVHPFFGKYRKDGRLGTPLIFEVRGHNIAVFLNHKERLAKLNFYRMSEVAEFEDEEEDEEYNNQELQLSKCFATWPENCRLLEDGTIINLDKKGGE
jgi:dCTP deaminase